MHPESMRVGDLARRTGLSVRTLHHYEEIGLLSPSRRTGAGYRLYGAPEIARLQQIVSLRQLGFSLRETRDCLSRPDYSLQRVIELHIMELRERIVAQSRLCERLEVLAEHVRSSETISVEEFLQTIEEMRRVEKYYTPEQLEELRQRRETIGDERIREVEAEWPQLMAQVRAEMDKGTDPTSETVRRLATRWLDLVNEFTGGNPEIEKSLRRMYQEESAIHGMDTSEMREMAEYISKATED